MDVFELAAKISLNTSDYESSLNSAGEKTNSFGDKLKSGLATAAKVGAAAITAATGAVAAFAKSSIDVGANFDASMSQVAATMGVTTDEIQNLREFAQEMGASTAFSATQAADALNYMALAGYDAEQSMTALPNVLNLAAAGGIELAEASDMVTDAQSALGLSFEESAELVDKMAQASSKSNTSVAQLGQAILTVGGTAKNLAGGTTELSTALGILADNGIKGAEGGTALRNIILSLSAPTDKAAEAMKDLGLKVYDAEGNMRPLNDVFNDLNSVLSTMTQGEQTNVLNTLFNKVDLKSANALLANSAERWDELSGYIDNAAGSAEKMAATQLDNLTGDITLMKSAMEGAQIVISDALMPTLREFVQFGTDGIGKIATAFQEDGLSGAMDAFGNVLSDGLAMVVEMLPEAVSAGMQLIGSVGQGILDNLPVIVEAAGEITTALVDSINLGQVLDEGMTILENLTDGILEYLPQMIDKLPEVIDGALNFFDEKLPVFLEKGGEILLKLALGIIEAIPKLVAKLPQIITSITKFLTDNWPKILKSGWDLLVKIGEGIINAIPQLVSQLPKIIYAIVNGIGSMMGTVINIGGDIVRGIWQGIQNAAGWFTSQVKGFFSGIVNSVKSVLGIASPSKVFAQIGGYMAEGLGEGWNDEYSSIKKDIESGLNFGTATIGVNTSVSGSKSASGTTYNTPTIHIENMTVRDEQDLDYFAQKVAKILYQMERSDLRGKGVAYA